MKEKMTLNLSLVGSGGDGVMSTASMLLRTASKRGLYGIMAQSYGPQIRGGESAAHVTISSAPVNSVGRTKDLVVCFRFADIGRFSQELKVNEETVLFHGTETGDFPEILKPAKNRAVSVPFTEVLEQQGLPEIAKNVFVFGVLLKSLGWDLEDGKHCVREVFGHKASAVISSNLRALESGFNHEGTMTLPFKIPSGKKEVARRVVTGNEACADAAIQAGCRFYAGYPITPSSEILEEMNERLPKVNGKLIQAEDEIAALGMVIGGSYGGIPSMTATSGPGLSLMSEMLGLSSMVEIPLVIVDCQRGGPSTGMPSRTEQSDLWHAVYGGHGDFPRVVLAPTNVADCYQTIFRAFYCAENFQLPVIVLSDALIAQSTEIIDTIDTSHFPRGKRKLAGDSVSAEGYHRFDLKISEEGCGVSPAALPGMPGKMHSIAGIEHTDRGFPSSDTLLHQKMNQKRFSKLEAIQKETTRWFHTVGEEGAPHLIVSWGSSAGVVKEYILKHKEFSLFVPEILHPFPVEALKKLSKGRKMISVLEMNYQGQLYHYLKGCGAIDGNVRSIKRSGGVPFCLEELENMLKEAL